MGLIEEEIKNQFEDSESYEGIDADKIWASVEPELEGGKSNGLGRIGVVVLVSTLIMTSFFIGRYTFLEDVENSNLSNEINRKNTIAQSSEISHSIEMEDLARKKEIEKSTKYEEVSINEKRTAEEISLVENNSEIESQIAILKVQDQLMQKVGESTMTKEWAEMSIVNQRSKSTHDFSSAEDSFKGFPLNPKSEVRDNSGELNQLNSMSLKLNDQGGNSIPMDMEFDLDKSTEIENEIMSSPKYIKEKSIDTDKEFIQLMDRFKGNISSYLNKGDLINNKRDIGSVNYLQKVSLPLEIVIYSGLNTTFNYYGKSDSNLQGTLSKTVFRKMGYSHGAKLFYVTKKGIRIGTGINLDLINSSFEYSDERSITLELENQLIDFDVSVAGDTLNPIYGDVTLDAIESRRVRHFNQFKLYSIPVQFGFEKNIGKLDLGLGLGASFNFYQSQSGRTLNKLEEISDFNSNSSSELPFKNNFLSFNLNPYLDYNLRNRIEVRTSIVADYRANGYSGLHDLNQNSLLLGLRFGLVYKL